MKEQILSELEGAHYRAAYNNRNNISTTVLLNTYAGSGSVTNAIAAALLTIGDMHAPLTAARNAIGGVHTLTYSGKYPGMGNSFHKDRIDPIFEDVYNLYTTFSQKLTGEDSGLDAYARYVNRETGKNLFPNAAGITGAICNLLDLPEHEEINIFIRGRLKGWIDLIRDYDRRRK